MPGWTLDSSRDVCAVQADIDSLFQWSEEWQLKLNPAKCKVLTLTPRTKPVIGVYTIGREELERVQEMRDLGVLIDKKLTFGAHVESVVKRGNRALGLLMRSLQTGKMVIHYIT